MNKLLLRAVHRWRRSSSAVSLSTDELTALNHEIHQELSSCVPVMREASQHLFTGKGKAIRPQIVLLMSRACNHSSSSTSSSSSSSSSTSSSPSSSSSSSSPSSSSPSSSWKECAIAGVTRGQWTVAVVTEMLHTASLLHDDIIDKSPLRRGRPSVHTATFAGNFILARASRLLARIGDTRTVELFAEVLEDLVGGEVMQLQERSGSSEDGSRLDHYLRKCFRKTASLMAHSCQAVAELVGCDEEVSTAAFNYGKNVGLSFQIIDDLLDFEGSSCEMGKAVAVDLQQGLVTAPVLLAAEQFPELDAMIERQFQDYGDTERAHQLIDRSSALARTRALAAKKSAIAVNCLQQLPRSLEHSALANIAHNVATRNK